MNSIIPIIVLIFIIRAIAGSVNGSSGGAFGRRQTVDAMIVAKRLNCSQHHHGAEIIQDHDRTTYHVTFQIDRGQRIELQVKESQYDLLFDGERGKLTFKGKRFIRFNAI